MPTNKIQLKKIKLAERANNESETPERRLRAAKSLLLFSKFSNRAHRLARRIANLFISDGLVTNEVRERAAKLLELVSSHAVNPNEEEDSDDEMPTQFQIQRPKKQKPKFSLEAIRKGDDLVAAFFEIFAPGEQGFPIKREDFQTAKENARQTLLETGGLANRTDRYDEVLGEFKALVAKILRADPSFSFSQNLARTCRLCAHGDHRLEHSCAEFQMDPVSAARVMQQAESAAPLASPTDYGVPVSLTRDQIVPRPDLSVPPELKPGEVNARATCRICIAGGFTLSHDCLQYQQDFS